MSQNVNDRLGNGTNALFFAVKYGAIRTVDLLLNAGIDIMAVDQFGTARVRVDYWYGCYSVGQRRRIPDIPARHSTLL
jgi:ankyrin repeat protein